MKTRGFTIIELIIVLVLIAIIAGVITPLIMTVLGTEDAMRLVMILVSIVVTAICGWAYAYYCAFPKRKWMRFIVTLVAVVIIVGAIGVGFFMLGPYSLMSV